MKKIFSLIALVLSVAMLLSSCNGVDLFRSADSLLSPPLYFDEYEGLVEVIRSDISPDSYFCTPYSGDRQSGIIVEDIDGDSENEAIVLYCDSVADQTAKIRFYDENDGEWSLSTSYIGYGNQVESVTVKDFDNNGINEIIVIWTMTGISTNKILTVYHHSENKAGYKEISNETCAATFIGDVDGDTFDEIFLITPNNNTASPQRFARIIGISSGSAVLKGETKVDANISSYSPINVIPASSSSPMMIYVDAFKGERQMITEVIYWDSENNELYNPFFNLDTMSNEATLRYDPIPSSDLNGDGVIDIPYQVEVLSSSADPIAIDPNNVYITSWLNCYPDGGFETVENALVNFEQGYKITVANEERYAITLERQSDNAVWTICEKDTVTGENIQLYSVITVSSESAQESNYPTVATADGFSVCVNIHQAGIDRGITPEVLGTKISLL